MLVGIEEFEKAEQYWSEQISGELNEMRLLVDFPGVKQYQEAHFTMAVPGDLAKKIVAVGKNNELSIFIFLLTVLKILLFKLSGQEDIVVGSPIYSSRNSPYNRYVVFRDRMDSRMTFKEFLMAVRETALEGYKNEHFPIKNLLDNLGYTDGFSLFRIILLMEGLHQKDLVADILADYENDLIFSFHRRNGGLGTDIQYNGRRFRPDSVQRIADSYLMLLRRVLHDTTARIAEIELNTGTERKKLLEEFNRTERDYPRDQTVHRLFERQVVRYPDRPAVRTLIDLTDIFDELEAATYNRDLEEKLARCCFETAPYLYRRRLQIDGDSGDYTFVKTRRHNCFIVNRNMLRLLERLDGRKDLFALFSQLKGSRVKLLLYVISMDDILEISYGFSDKAELTVDDDMKPLISLVKLAYRNNLVQLAGIQAAPVPVSIREQEPFDEHDLLENTAVLDRILGQKHDLSVADVLILGDTMGMASVGVLYLASYLRRHGFKTYAQFNDFCRHYDGLKKNIEELLKSVRPRVVAVSLKWFLYISRVIDMCRIVKNHSPDVKVVVGGNTASFYWRELIAYDCIDYVVRGDGELPLLKICRGEADDDIPNCVYKKNGEIKANPFGYVQGEADSPDIYLSHLDEILLAPRAPLVGSFFIYTHKGCLKNCFYCGGCKAAMQKIFNRGRLADRGVKEVRLDIEAAREYASTFMFDFDAPNDRLLVYLKKIWQGIDLGSHFCTYCNTLLPGPELIEFVNRTFNYVFYELDLTSLSQRHRRELFHRGIVKRQPVDEEILAFLAEVEKYDNAEVRINLITGLPYYTLDDIEESRRMLAHIMETYSRFSALHWARLHAQPGAAIVEDAGRYDMHSGSVTFADFLACSRENFNMTADYPDFETYNYPYIYYMDEEMNSRISEFYSRTNLKLLQHRENERRNLKLCDDLTYRELNSRANRLARVLRKKRIGRDDVVALLLTGGTEIVTGILGVLKAGAAYLPIDPEFPPERVAYFLNQSGSTVLVTQESLLGSEVLRSVPAHQILVLDGPVTEGEETADLLVPASPRDLAYMIYTSGTTGNPRGTLVEHRGVVNYTWWRLQTYGYSEEDVTLEPLSYCFDGFVSNFYSALLSGSALVMIPGSKRLDFHYIKESVKHFGVTNSSLVPGIFDALLDAAEDEALKAFRFVVLAGEKSSTDLIRKCRRRLPGVMLFNEYGPTETTVTAAGNWRIKEDNPGIIGQPIANVRLYILDTALRPVPVGVPGELCVAGAGVGRGYLNDPELTARAYVENPFVPGERLYRTGDLACWLSGGTVAFLGRRDHQVKVRGFRIEMGEVENEIMKFEAVKSALVDVREDNHDHKYLCAYIVPRSHQTGDGIETAFPLAPLREFLLRSLPDYMIPAHFVVLERFPMTATGKVDRRSLPAPDSSADEVYESPRSEVERKLVEIWQKVLGRDRLGINDNFFMVGGDSIKAIQITSQLGNLGYRLQVRSIFLNPRISQLASLVEKIETAADQSPVTGTLQLTPVQRRFFDGDPRDRHHFNQAVMLYSKEGFGEEMIRQLFTKIQQHHDALRMSFRDEGGTVVQTVNGPDQPLWMQVHDLRRQAGTREALLRETDIIQAGIDLETGPLMKLGLFHLDDGDRLLIVIHHLVVDGVSWRILFEDIENLYQQYRRGKPLTLPPRTDSFKVWAEKLNEYARNDDALEPDRLYWGRQENSEVPVIPRDLDGERYLKDSRKLSVTLGREETDLLLTRVNHAFGTEINDILLTALALSVRDTYGHDALLVDLEGHGREEVLADVDIHRTVGWFTTVYPVILKTRAGGELSRQIKEIKETLRRVPNRGIGYGILKYLTPPQQREELAFNLSPRMTFNYLGQFDSDFQRLSFTLAPESSGRTVSLNRQLAYDIEVVGMIAGGKLSVTMTFSRNQYKDSTIESLLNRFSERMGDIISLCSGRRQRELTPVDLTCPDVSIDTLEQLCRRYPVEDILPLSPLQEGIFFHALYDRQTRAYFGQMSYRIEGNLDEVVVKLSLEYLFRRYAVLRSVFVSEGLERPLQLVLKERPVDFYFEDIGENSPGVDADERLRIFRERDKERLFDLSRDVLLRAALFRLGDGRFEFIWSFHHILLDGWSIGILIPEFFTVYNALLQSGIPQLTEISSAAAYFDWLQAKDRPASAAYWQSYLADYEEAASLPGRRTYGADGSEYKNEVLRIEVDQDRTARLNELAARNQVTLNTLIQAAWGLLLARYTGRQDVVFGAVVSGRSAEVKGIESMVGLFLNTVPVRIRYHREQTFKHLLKTVQQEALESEPHHYYPLADIQNRSILRQNLLNHLLVFENYPVSEQPDGSVDALRSRAPQPGFRISRFELVEQTHYDLNMIVAVGRCLGLYFKYNAHAYDEDLLSAAARHLLLILDRALENGEMRLGDLDLLGEDERQRILSEFNDTAVRFPGDSLVHELFEMQACRHPQHTALVYGDGRCLTYRDLNDRAGALGRLLRTRGVRPDSLVAIAAQRSPQMVVGIMAVLKAGGAYLPVDPGFPVLRKRYMVRDSGAGLILSHRGQVREMEDVCDVVDLEAERVYRDGGAHLEKVNTPENLAYAMYTSGSTGKPKGTLIRHRGLTNVLRGLQQEYPLTREDAYLLKTPYIFDVSLAELFGWFWKGGRLVIPEPGAEKDPHRLLDMIEQHRVTHLNFVPSMFAVFLAFLSAADIRRLGCLKYIFLAGEALPPALVAQFNALDTDITLENIYGPTEATIYASRYSLAGWDGSHDIAIGKPRPNTRLYILDPRSNVQPVGVPGELFIAGTGLARGYLNNPELTAERFVEWKSSLHSVPQTLYRTGDRVRWLPDGHMEFLGRMDRQIKIRGLRIELDEIRHRLLQFGDIEDAAVVERQGTAAPAGVESLEDKYLCAYIAAPETLKVDELRVYLSRHLPDYMIPAYFVRLRQLPLNPSGKLDLYALPEPVKVTADDDNIPPRDEIETQLAEIWARNLEIDPEMLGIDANFFVLGGHSLKATRVILNIHKRFHVRMPLARIFQSPTIRGLAEYIRTAATERFTSLQAAEKRDYYYLSSAQKRLYFIQQLEKESSAYNTPQIKRLKDIIDVDRLQATFWTLIARHESLRTSFVMVDEEPVQRIHRPGELTFTVTVEEKSSEETGAAVGSFVQPFDLGRAPLLRAALIKLKEGHNILLVDMHHIITDAASMEIFIREFRILYEGGELSALKLQYKDYSQWQNRLLSTGEGKIERQERYWLDMFAGEIQVLNLPTDYPRSAELSFRGGSFSFTVDKDLSDRIKAFALATSTTPDIVLLTVYNVLLFRYTGQEDIVVGIPVAGRTHIDLQEIIGFFANMLALRNPLRETTSFRAFLAEVKENSLKAYENQDYQFDELVWRLGIQRQPGRHPLVDTVFTTKNISRGSGEVTAGQRAPSASDTPDFGARISHFDLMYHAVIADRSIEVLVEYSVELFKKSTMEDMAAHFVDILRQVMENGDIPLKEITVAHDFLAARPDILRLEQEDWLL